MAQVVSPHLKTLIFDALLASFWRKPALQRFVRDCGISHGFAATLGSGETKRAFLERLFAEVERGPRATAFLLNMANALAEQKTFPDLQNWEDSKQKIAAAERAVSSLRAQLRSGGVDIDSESRRVRAKTREAALNEKRQLVQGRLSELKVRLGKLAMAMGTQRAGYEFQEWFYDLMAFSEVVARPPYVIDGRQIDGTITVEGTTYVTELKFTQGQVGAPDVDTLAQKVSKKADNTMGVMVSMSGYSGVAISEASGAGTKLLLLDYAHINLVLDGHDFSEILGRVRRHASQTGRAYLEVHHLG
jgi:hypothetical protein